MSVSLADISQAGISVASLFAGFLKTIAPPERALIKWTGLAAVVAGLAFLFVKLLAQMSTHREAATYWAIVACSSIVLSMVVLFVYLSALQARTIDYAGQSRIVGTEYTQAANAYRTQHPTFTREQILFDYTGDTSQVWTPASLQKSTLLLGVEYSLFIVCLAFGLNLGVEVLTNTVWTRPTAPSQPGLQQRAAAVKDVHFKLDESNLEQDAIERLADNAEIVRGILKDFPQAHVIVEGHCDDRGSVERNLTLGYRRAKTVTDGLAQAGIPRDRLQMASYGKGTPLCSDAVEECHRKNRRAHLTVVE